MSRQLRVLEIVGERAELRGLTTNLGQVMRVECVQDQEERDFGARFDGPPALSGIDSSSAHIARAMATRSPSGRASRRQTANSVAERADRLDRHADGAVDGRGFMSHPDGDLVFLDVPGMIAVRDQDRCPLLWREIVRHVVDGAAIQLEGLAPGGQSGRLVGPGQRGFEGLAAETGALVVDRGVDLGRSLEPRPELTGTGVESPPIRGRDRAGRARRATAGA